MNSISKKYCFLSCDTKDSQSFLSCDLRNRTKLPSVRKPIQNFSPVSALSCVNRNDQESQNDGQTGYRASKPLIVGIDPGITGAIAIITLGQNPKFEAVYDLPTLNIKGKVRIDFEAFASFISLYSKEINLAAIEEVGFMKGKEARGSAFVFGFATGGIHGVLAAFFIKISSIKPLVWKGALGLSSNKEESLLKARKLFPDAGPFLQRKKDHGRAEALLLAYFANSVSRSSWKR